MDLAIDALLQARNLDRIILLTGDGDFIRLVLALQNMGCRVEVIGFNNVSRELKEAADSYLSGYLVPGLLPVIDHGDGERLRGVPINYNPERGFGFMKYYSLQQNGLHMKYYSLQQNGLRAESVFFHCSKAVDLHDTLFLDSANIFEFSLAENQENGKRTEAVNICHIAGDRTEHITTME